MDPLICLVLLLLESLPIESHQVWIGKHQPALDLVTTSGEADCEAVPQLQYTAGLAGAAGPGDIDYAASGLAQHLHHLQDSFLVS